MTNKEKIIIFYYEKRLNTIEISEKLKISKQYVSKIVRNDTRYINERNRRKSESAIKQRNRNIDCIKKKRQKNKLERVQADASLQKSHIQASIDMSGRRTINNRAFRNWNSSIYQYYERTKEYRIKDKFKNKVSYAVPKKIKWY